MCAAFARRVRSVVTGKTTVRNIGVIKIRRHPGDCRVAVITVIAAGDMVRVFSDGCHAVMAGPTGTEHLRVIDHCDRSEHIARVAVLANIRRLNVCCRFADGVGAVVAVEAITHDIDVVKVGR